MRTLRILGHDVWYKIITRINNREALLNREGAVALLLRVFEQALGHYDFEVRLLWLGGDTLTFYIKPADGLQLPLIMKWVKQVFAQRYNAKEGRCGHIWGDRYWSQVLEGEPPDGQATEDVGCDGVGGADLRLGRRTRSDPRTGSDPNLESTWCGRVFRRFFPF
jgi:REP element-mobilizing transposase RayT